MKDLKKTAAALYFCMCLFALSSEPTEEVSMFWFTVYVFAVIVNLAFSALIINKTFK